jgi:hypothetical protein
MADVCRAWNLKVNISSRERTGNIAVLGEVAKGRVTRG